MKTKKHAITDAIMYHVMQSGSDSGIFGYQGLYQAVCNFANYAAFEDAMTYLLDRAHLVQINQHSAKLNKTKPYDLTDYDPTEPLKGVKGITPKKHKPKPANTITQIEDKPSPLMDGFKSLQKDIEKTRRDLSKKEALYAKLNQRTKAARLRPCHKCGKQPHALELPPHGEFGYGITLTCCGLRTVEEYYFTNEPQSALDALESAITTWAEQTTQEKAA